MKRIIALFLTILITLVPLSGCAQAAEPQAYQNYEALIVEQEDRMDTAHIMAEAARKLGYAETNVIITTAQSEWQTAYAQEQTYLAEQKEWDVKETEYPTATYVWEYLQGTCGYNNYVCAGILGNMMAECGGQGLTLQWSIYNSTGSYYGLCQWYKGYGIHGASLEEQCEFLAGNIEYEFNTYGKNYKKGFNYSSFLSMTDEQEAAKAFAKCYERCASFSYSKRQTNATTAYNYFVN